MLTNHPNDPDSTDYNAAYEQFISEVAGHLIAFDYNSIGIISGYDFVSWVTNANTEANEDDEPLYSTEVEVLIWRTDEISIHANGLAADFADWINEDDDDFFRKLDYKYRWENGNG